MNLKWIKTQLAHVINLKLLKSMKPDELILVCHTVDETKGVITPGLISTHSFFDRSDYRTPLKGLYLCGSGTHPGGGVMGAPGRNAAHMALQDLKSP